MKWLWLLFWCVAHARAQSVGFISGQVTSCSSAAICPIRTQISNDVSGAVANTMKLTFTPADGGAAITLRYSGNSQDVSMNINPITLLSSSTTGGGVTVICVSPGSVVSLPDGNYTVTASYQRVTNDAIVTSSPLNWTLWARTPPPYFIDFPHVNQLPLVVQVGWPSNPFGSNATTTGTRSLSWSNQTHSMGFLMAETTDVVLDPASDYQNGTGVVAMSSPFYPSDGEYNLTFSYRDSRPHTAASVTVTFRLDTTTQPLNITLVTSTYLVYYVTEAGTMNVADQVFVGVPNCYFFPPVATEVTLIFTDTLGNPPASVTVTIPISPSPAPAPAPGQVCSDDRYWYWVGAIIGLGSALAVSLMVNVVLSRRIKGYALM